MQGSIRVWCRVRPILDVERKSIKDSVDVTTIPLSSDEITIQRDELTKQRFEYDHVFAPNSTQVDVFNTVQPFCVSVLDGYNVCLFACKYMRVWIYYVNTIV